VVSAFSLGAAAAIFSSLECPDAFDGHLLEAPYRDLPRAAANRLRERLPGPAASLAYVAMEVVARLMLPVPPDEISPRKVAARLRGKPNVLFVAHADDPKCHLDEVQAVYARVGPPAKLIVLSRGGHKSFFRSDPQAYFEALGRLSQTPRKQPQP
jgi:alpha-beta hydrolase superfamily lysophospholipase